MNLAILADVCRCLHLTLFGGIGLQPVSPRKIGFSSD